MTETTKSTAPQKVMIRGVIYRVLEDRVVVMGRSGPRVELQVRAEVKGLPVTAINRHAFTGDEKLLSIKLPKTLVTIGSHSFEGCTALTEIELPTNLENINWHAFAGCTSLVRVFLPHRLKKIGHHAFAGCTALEELPHFVQTGPRSQAKLSRSLIESSLPVTLTHIGKSAFENCTSLKRIVIPFGVTKILDDSFNGCIALDSVWLHSHMTSLGQGAFAGCSSLATLRVPSTISEIGTTCLSPNTTVVTEADSEAANYAVENGLSMLVTSLPDSPIHSYFGATEDLTISQVINDEQMLGSLATHYEVRPAALPYVREDYAPQLGIVPPSRFELNSGVYREKVQRSEDQDVTLALAGDLMCGFRQQRQARVGNTYKFDEQLVHIAPILAKADLSIGNLETMSSPDLPFASERLYIDDRPNLNSPIEYLAAVRRAGFDAVMSAQNHMYDTGVRGVLNTLDALNTTELVHGGMFAGPHDPRFIQFEIKGMRIAVVAYLDPLRQRMKQANFTAQGLNDMTSLFDEDNIRADIAAARSNGAEFILAYAHWGVEYTANIHKRQAAFAQLLADGGVDYIFGSHSHCPQPYVVTESSDGRQVPTLYSASNFLSDIQRHAPITSDSLIGLLTLTRNAHGKIMVKGDGYIPCKIVHADRAPMVTVVPCEVLAHGLYGFTQSESVTDAQRISSVLGNQYQPILLSHVRNPDEDNAVWEEAISAPEPVVVAEEHVPNDYGFNPLVALDKNSLESALIEVQALSFGLTSTRYSPSVFTAQDAAGKSIGFKRVASNQTSMVGVEFCADKILCKTLLLEQDLPTAFGLPMPRKGFRAARQFVEQYGWPVVVKPRRGSGGRAVTANIQTHEQLEAAVRTADEFGGFLIERHVPGEDYRFLVSGDEVLGVWCRDAANVTGDGISTIDTLIGAKNLVRATNPHLASRLIERDPSLINHLRRTNRDLQYVPLKGEKVYLRSAANLSAGGDNIDVTDETHSSLKEIAVRAKKSLPGIELVGIDFLISDHRLSTTEQTVNICEINSTPGISAHEYPMFGLPRPAAQNYVAHIASQSGLNLGEYESSAVYEMKINGAFSDHEFLSAVSEWAEQAQLHLITKGINSTEVNVTFEGTSVAAAYMSWSALRSRSASGRVVSCNVSRLKKSAKI